MTQILENTNAIIALAASFSAVIIGISGCIVGNISTLNLTRVKRFSKYYPAFLELQNNEAELRLKFDVFFENSVQNIKSPIDMHVNLQELICQYGANCEKFIVLYRTLYKSKDMLEIRKKECWYILNIYVEISNKLGISNVDSANIIPMKKLYLIKSSPLSRHCLKKLLS